VPAPFAANPGEPNPPTNPWGAPAPGSGWGAPAPGSGGWPAPQYPPPSGSYGGGSGGPGGPTGGDSGPARSGPLGGRRRLIAGAAALALLSAAIGGGIGALVADNDHTTTVISSTGAGLTQGTDTNPVSPAAAGTVSKAAQVILPSVVTISTVSSSEAGTGSGVIIRSDGYILTNNHVVSGAQGSGSLTVTLEDGSNLPATVVGTDPSSDLAVIKIDKTGLTAATFGDSDQLQVGELVVAVGSPLGLSDTVTSGIVSALHRPVRTGDSSVSNDANAVLDAIQTDTAINPGNSGGPLVNNKGQVVGINSAIATVGGGSSSPFGQSQQSGNIGVGFAITSNYAEKIANQLIQNGRAVHPYLGISASDASSNPTGTGVGGTGAQISSLVSGGPAAQAGLQPGDVITKVDNRPVTDVDSLIAAVRAHDIGQTVTVTYTRGGSSQTAKVTLAEQPSS
jgi:putative serine protease PepD